MIPSKKLLPWKKTPLYYAIGALIIDYTMKNYGPEKVKKLFQYEKMEEMFREEFGVPAGDIHSFITSIAQEY